MLFTFKKEETLHFKNIHASNFAPFSLSRKPMRERVSSGFDRRFVVFVFFYILIFFGFQFLFDTSGVHYGGECDFLAYFC